ncbi:AI-2E family transporter [Prauserella marina]|nr:AI-2E family transporter [Prauserella marina]
MRNPGPERLASGMPRALVILIAGACLVVIIAGLKLGAWLIAPVFLAMVIVITLRPVPQWLRRHGVPAGIATALLILLVYALVAALVVILVVSIAQLASLLPAYAERADDLLDGLKSLLAHWNISPEQLRPATDQLDFDRLLGYVGNLLGSVTSIGTSILFVLALLLFFCIEASGAGARQLALQSDRPAIGSAISGFVRGTRRYMFVTTVFGLIVAVLDTIALEIMGIPLPLLWGVLAFITNYIPNVGFILGLAPPAILGLLEGGWQTLLAVIVVYSALNFVIQSVIQPRFVGQAVGISTIATFLSLVLWGWVLGPLGAILAIPLTLLAKALLVDVDPRARWVDDLLASRATGRAEAPPRPSAEPEKS